MNSNFLYKEAGPGKYQVVSLLSIGIIAFLLLYRVLLIFSYNGELAGIDNNFVYDVSRSIAGSGPYSHPAQPPFAITLYSPLYFSVCAFIGKIFQIDPDNAIDVYQLCRSLSLFADIITCLLLCRILKKRFQADNKLVWLAVAGFACILCKLGYTFSRSDSFLLAFYAAVLYVLTRRPLKGIGQIILLSLFSVGCILSKQNGIIVPVLVITWLLLVNEKKAAARFSIFFLLAGTASILIYRAIYPHLFLNMVTALQNRVDLSWFYSDIFKRSMDSLWILPLYFGFMLAIGQWRKPKQPEDKAMAAILLVQILFGLAISLKWGSSVSYFNESFLLAFIILFRKMADQQQPIPVRYVQKGMIIILPLLVLFFVHTIAEGYLFFLQNRGNKKMAYQQQKEIRDYLRPKLKDQYVMNLTDPNTSFFKTLFYKEMAVPNMDMADCCTIPDQNFDYSVLREDLENGKIGYLLMGSNEKPGTIWNVSLQHYTKDTVMYGYAIYTFTTAAGESNH